MCVGDAMQLIAVDGIAGTAKNDSGQSVLIDLSLIPDAKKGDWVVSFLGTAREIVSADEAHKIMAAVAGLRAVMQGKDLGQAFADLDERAPTLPPHLQAALDAGLTKG